MRDLVDATNALFDRDAADLVDDARSRTRAGAGLPDALESLTVAIRGLASELVDRSGPGVEEVRRAAVHAATVLGPKAGSADATATRVSDVAFHLLRATGLDAGQASAATGH